MGQGSSSRWPKKPENPSSWWPDDIRTNFDDGFTYGTVEGSGFYFIRGFIRPAHAESMGRFATGFKALRGNALLVGSGTLALLLLGLDALVDHALYKIRGVDDPYNTAIAAAVTAATATASRGALPVSCFAIGSGAFGFLVHSYYDQVLEMAERWREKVELEKARLLELYNDQ